MTQIELEGTYQFPPIWARPLASRRGLLPEERHAVRLALAMGLCGMALIVLAAALLGHDRAEATVAAISAE